MYKSYEKKKVHNTLRNRIKCLDIKNNKKKILLSNENFSINHGSNTRKRRPL